MPDEVPIVTFAAHCYVCEDWEGDRVDSFDEAAEQRLAHLIDVHGVSDVEA